MSEKTEGHLSFACAHCGKKLRVKEKAAGRRLECPNCGKEIAVPHQPENTSPSLSQMPSDDRPIGGRRPSLFDVDDLILEEAPIENLQERKRQSQEIQDARAAEQRRRLAVDQQRRAPKEKNSEVIQAHSRRDTLRAQFEDAYIPLEEPTLGSGDNHHPSSGRVEASSGEPSSDASAPKKTAFDDDLPNLITANETVVTSLNANSASLDAEAELEKIVASLGKQAIELDLESLSPKDFPSVGATNKNVSLPDSNKPQESFEEKYRVTCPTCGTLQYVSRAQQGSQIKCPDCTSKIRVPPPPPNWKPSRVQKRHNEFDVQAPLEESSQLSEIDDRRKKQTQSLLDRAEVELSQEEEEGRLYGTDFDTPGFLRRTFGFALDPVAVGIMMGYSAVFALVFAMLQFGLSSDGSAFRQGVTLFCLLTAPVLAIVFSMPMFSAALAQLEAAANQQNKVTDWPSMNVFDHFGDIMAVTIALLAAAIPGYLLGSWLGADLVTAGRIQITGAMFTTFLLFPLLYLSILDNGSVLQLVSQDVMRSIREVGEAWGGYYLKTLIVFSATLIVWYLLLGTGKSPVMAAIAGAMLPGLTFFTFHQLGLLADSIGENLSPLQTQQSKEQVDDLEDEMDSI